VRAYREKMQLQASAELQRALRQLEAGQDPTEVLQRFQQSLINKILHAPSVQLRRLAAEQREDALRVAREILLADPASDFFSLPEDNSADNLKSSYDPAS
jgi:glutamyl-tRNA reductase